MHMQTSMACAYLDDVFIMQHMLLADLLRAMLDRRAPYQCILELLDDALVYPVAKVLHLRDKSDESQTCCFSSQHKARRIKTALQSRLIRPYTVQNEMLLV